jgi:hypothetical protein
MKAPFNISRRWPIASRKETDIINGRECSKKHVLAKAGSPPSKTAAIVTRGGYAQYVSTAQWRERRWRLFSTFPWNI